MNKNQRYIMITTEQVYIPGDERSLTNPGHGYPSRTLTYEKTKIFNSEQELIDWLSSWGKDVKNPFIFELGKQVSIEMKPTLVMK